ncbi:hypothetical protein ACIQVK_28505 [Streptomyces sp. NPDC090493]|uniref:hypothetical protein n=1 Tax=Streptomyces sp. NPDC090493 TaxID=3365964 RepID=UPI0038124786
MTETESPPIAVGRHRYVQPGITLVGCAGQHTPADVRVSGATFSGDGRGGSTGPPDARRRSGYVQEPAGMVGQRDP